MMVASNHSVYWSNEELLDVVEKVHRDVFHSCNLESFHLLHKDGYGIVEARAIHVLWLV